MLFLETKWQIWILRPRPAKYRNGSLVPTFSVCLYGTVPYIFPKRIQNRSEVRRRKLSPKTSLRLCSLSTMAPPISCVLPRVFQSQHSGTSCLWKRCFPLRAHWQFGTKVLTRLKEPNIRSHCGYHLRSHLRRSRITIAVIQVIRITSSVNYTIPAFEAFNLSLVSHTYSFKIQSQSVAQRQKCRRWPSRTTFMKYPETRCLSCALHKDFLRLDLGKFKVLIRLSIVREEILSYAYMSYNKSSLLHKK